MTAAGLEVALLLLAEGLHVACGTAIGGELPYPAQACLPAPIAAPAALCPFLPLGQKTVLGFEALGHTGLRLIVGSSTLLSVVKSLQLDMASSMALVLAQRCAMHAEAGA